MNSGKKKKTIFVCGCILFVLVSSACRESTSPQDEALSGVIDPEIDVNKITNATAVNLKILKAVTIGRMPRNKFYWVSIDNKVSPEKAEQLADAIIRETIAKTREPYHSITIHFFFKDDLKNRIENSRAMAHASFLPEGGWSRVGREPINNYHNYKLTCKLVE